MSSHEQLAARIFRECLPETERLLAEEVKGASTAHMYAPRAVRGTTRAWNNKRDGGGLRGKLSGRKLGGKNG